MRCEIYFYFCIDDVVYPVVCNVVKYTVAFDTDLLIGLGFICKNVWKIYPVGCRVKNKSRSHALQPPIGQNSGVPDNASKTIHAKPSDHVPNKITRVKKLENLTERNASTAEEPREKLMSFSGHKIVQNNNCQSKQLTTRIRKTNPNSLGF